MAQNFNKIDINSDPEIKKLQQIYKFDQVYENDLYFSFWFDTKSQKQITSSNASNSDLRFETMKERMIEKGFKCLQTNKYSHDILIVDKEERLSLFERISNNIDKIQREFNCVCTKRDDKKIVFYSPIFKGILLKLDELKIDYEVHDETSKISITMDNNPKNIYVCDKLQKIYKNITINFKLDPIILDIDNLEDVVYRSGGLIDQLQYDYVIDIHRRDYFLVIKNKS